MIVLTAPTHRAYVSGGWGEPRSYRGGWHAGLDFPDKEGAPMLAAADGVVSYVTRTSMGNAGKFLVIDHGNGISSRYLHARTITVNPGDRVSRGDVVGTVGTTGTTSSAPHVHFDIKLEPDALARYAQEYGTPTTGFSRAMSWGRGAPAETFMSGATYKPGVLEASKARGVQPYKPSYGWLVAGGLAIVAGLVAARYVK